jgi:hypothetical protein
MSKLYRVDVEAMALADNPEDAIHIILHSIIPRDCKVTEAITVSRNWCNEIPIGSLGVETCVDILIRQRKEKV